MTPNQSLTDALAAITEAKPGRQRQVRIKRAMRAAVVVDEEQKNLYDKLERQWDWLCRNSETEPEYQKREALFFKTLIKYEGLCEQLIAAGKVLLS